MNKTGAVYIMSSPNKGVLYTGVTSNLNGRVWKHRNKFYPNSFTTKYNCVMLVYYHYYDSMEAAIMEEKRIKGGSRNDKEELINTMNSEWNDLWDDINKQS